MFPGDFHALKKACLVLSKTMNPFATLIDKFQIVKFVQLLYSVDLTATNFKGAVILHMDIPASKTAGDAPLYPSVFTSAHSSSILTAFAILRVGYTYDPQQLQNIKLSGCQFLVFIQGGHEQQ